MAHLIVAALTGLVFYNIGKDAMYSLDNVNVLFYFQMFLMFTAFSVTLVACKNILS